MRCCQASKQIEKNFI